MFLNRSVETLIETAPFDEHVSKKCNVNISLAHTDTNRKFAAQNHSKVKQFDKEDILNRFKRADSTIASQRKVGRERNCGKKLP